VGRVDNNLFENLMDLVIAKAEHGQGQKIASENYNSEVRLIAWKR